MDNAGATSVGEGDGGDLGQDKCLPPEVTVGGFTVELCIQAKFHILFIGLAVNRW